MIYCENLLWSKNCRWNRVKMVKNGPKMPKIILRASLMIDINIFNIFLFFNFFFSVLYNPCICQNFKKKTLNTGSNKYPKEKVEKTKNVKNVNIYHIWDPKNNISHFWPILDHFYPISPANFLSEQNFAIDHFRDPPILDRLGK